MSGHHPEPQQLSDEDRAITRQLRERLAAARAAGEPFPEAWHAALETLDLPTDPPGLCWRYALEQTRHAWARAYVGRRRHRGSEAAASLADAMP